nr:Uncharacterized membrane protein YjcC [Klebsiella pneumoniae]
MALFIAGYLYSLAEQTGLITQLTEDIVRKIFTDLGPWLRQRPEVHISINLSVDDLRSPTLPTLLHNQLQHWGSPPNRSSLKSPSAVLSTRRRLCR